MPQLSRHAGQLRAVLGPGGAVPRLAPRGALEHAGAAAPLSLHPHARRARGDGRGSLRRDRGGCDLRDDRAAIATPARRRGAHSARVARHERRHRARAVSAGLFAVKAISAAAEAGEQPLIRVLSLPSLTAFGIGSIIGTGIFVLTGTAAANHAGPALVISFLLAGCAGAFAALSYAELASMIPIAGSAYSYAYATLGELAAWFIGWNLVLEYTFSVGTVAIGWSAYVVSLLAQFGIHLPEALIQAPIDRGPGDVGLIVTGAVLNLPAVLIVAVVAYICYIGIRQSAAINFAFVVLKIAVVLGFVLLGAGFVNRANWHPFVPANTGHFGHFGWSGVFAAAGIMFFAFIGFDTVSTCAQEARNPRRDVPLGIVSSLAICSVLYVATALVLTGMVPYSDLDVAAPVALAIDAHAELRWLGLPVKLGAIVAMISVMLVMTVGQARIFMAMAADGLLPSWFASVHPRFHTPAHSTVVTWVGATLIGGLL
ncbi:MAG: amino acid permease, partial [Gammaproteobacteria bacterium]